MSVYSVGLYEKALPASLSWAEKLAAAKEAGYGFLEISVDETDEKLSRLEWGAAERRALLETMFDSGLPVRTMCLSGHRKYPLGSEDPRTRERSLDIMEKAIDLAADLGVRIIQLAGYDVYYEPHTERSAELFAEGLAQSVRMAARRGVFLAFETMETEFMNTVAKAMVHVRRVGSPYLGVYPDCGNMTNTARASGVSELDDLRSGAGHIAALHLKETRPGVFREVPYGAGHVDFAAVIRTALDIGVRLFVTEFWYTGEEDWRAMVRESKAFIDERFRAAGVSN